MIHEARINHIMSVVETYAESHGITVSQSIRILLDPSAFSEIWRIQDLEEVLYILIDQESKKEKGESCYKNKK